MPGITVSLADNNMDVAWYDGGRPDNSTPSEHTSLIHVTRYLSYIRVNGRGYATSMVAIGAYATICMLKMSTSVTPKAWLKLHIFVHTFCQDLIKWDILGLLQEMLQDANLAFYV